MSDYSQGQNNDLTSQYSGDEIVLYERLLDLIAEALIVSEFVNTADVENNQKFILNGQLQVGQGSGVLALFQKDIKANQEDLNNTTLNNEAVAENLIQIAINLNFDELSTPPINVQGGGEFGVTISINGGGTAYNGLLITNLVVADGNPLNVSQFVPIQEIKSVVDIDKAEEFLDTNIYELLPTSDTRQSRIIRLFQELNALLPPTPPEFDLDNNGAVDRDETTNWSGDTQYQQDNSISYAQNNQDGNIDEDDAFIHRLKETANDTNSTKTIEDIYNSILPYLTDLLEDPIELEDMPKYKNQSSGYLQFRNLNQGVIIRNTNKQFIEGLNPNNPTYLNEDGTGGFTITTWVRFLDKTSQGTLFNFGNPTRAENPFGFKLETYVLNKDDDNPHSMHGTWGDGADAIYNGDGSRMYFENSNTARFVRLVVNDNGTTRDSHIGVPGAVKQADIPDMDGDGDDEFRLLQTTFIPEDFQEWYFICASFNPTVDEDNSYVHGYNNDPNFWLNHINPDDGLYTNSSNYGNRCKVEIISRSDLLRARGFNS